LQEPNFQFSTKWRIISKILGLLCAFNNNSLREKYRILRGAQEKKIIRGKEGTRGEN
jgi:hypothetical protein